MGKCGRRAYCYLHPHARVKPDTLFSSHSLHVFPLLFSSPSLGEALYPIHSIALHDGCAVWGMGCPGGHGVVSGLNSILYQTHLYLHKQEACLLGRESTAIHFLSGRLADVTKTWTAAALGSVGRRRRWWMYILWFGELRALTSCKKSLRLNIIINYFWNAWNLKLILNPFTFGCCQTSRPS